MPAEDGLRPDDDEGRAPPVPDPCQAHPECPLGMTQPGSYNLAAEDGELLPEGEILQSQLRTVPEEGAEEQEDDSENGHREVRQGVSPGQTLKPSKERADRIISRDRPSGKFGCARNELTGKLARRTLKATIAHATVGSRPREGSHVE